MTETYWPASSSTTPRYAGPVSFFRLPTLSNPADADIALIGLPYDGGTTNRAGARHGPREVRSQSSLMRRYGSLDEQAGVILFLASDDASYLTGVTIPVGGGDLG